MLWHDFIKKLKGVSRDHVNDADQLVSIEGDENHQVSQQAIANYYALDALLHACGIGCKVSENGGALAIEVHSKCTELDACRAIDPEKLQRNIDAVGRYEEACKKAYSESATDEARAFFDRLTQPSFHDGFNWDEVWSKRNEIVEKEKKQRFEHMQAILSEAGILSEADPYRPKLTIKDDAAALAEKLSQLMDQHKQEYLDYSGECDFIITKPNGKALDAQQAQGALKARHEAIDRMRAELDKAARELGVEPQGASRAEEKPSGLFAHKFALREPPTSNRSPGA